MAEQPVATGDPPEDRAALLRRLWSQGATLDEMGQALTVSRERARQLLGDIGLSVQGRQQRRKAYVASRYGQEIEALFYSCRDDATVGEALGLRVDDVRDVVEQR